MRAEDAWRRFSASPLAQVAARLQREVLVQSVYGTNTIEGGELSEEETGRALDLDPALVQAEQDVRVRNISAGYALAMHAGNEPGWRLSIPFIQAVHAEITRDLETDDNRAGRFRDTPKSRPTVVGSAEHGGIYRPPQFGRDIIEAGMPIPGKVLRADPRYIALYARLAERTAARDLRQLVELGLLAQDAQGRWMPGPRQD